MSIELFVHVNKITRPAQNIFLESFPTYVEEDSQITILLYKPYLAKVTSKEGGEGVKNPKKIVYVVYGWILANLPCSLLYTEWKMFW